MVFQRHRILLVLLFLTFGAAAEARADWLFTPFLGTRFAIETSHVLLEPGAEGAKLIFGGSAALLSGGIFGIEADWGYAPHFFEDDNRGGAFSGSNVNTLMGSMIFAVPLSVTRESLRPYAIGGFGLMHAAAKDAVFDELSFAENFGGYNAGAGAIGLISPRTGFRFEIRHFRSLQNRPNELTGESGARLSFWRATVGVVIRVPN